MTNQEQSPVSLVDNRESLVPKGLRYAYINVPAPHHWDQSQDAVTVEQSGDHYLLGVFDGMGGHSGGAYISKRVAELVVDEFYEYDFEAVTPESISISVADILDSTHSKVASKNEREAAGYPDAGTTATIGLVAKLRGRDYLAFAHAGDTRLGLLRNGKFKFLTEDEGEGSRLRNGVGPAFSGSYYKGINQFGLIEVGPGDRIVLMSDGICGDYPEQFLSQSTYEKALDASHNPEDAVNNLLRASIKENDKSVIVFDIPNVVELNPDDALVMIDAPDGAEKDNAADTARHSLQPNLVDISRISSLNKNRGVFTDRDLLGMGATVLVALGVLLTSYHRLDSQHIDMESVGGVGIDQPPLAAYEQIIDGLELQITDLEAQMSAVNSPEAQELVQVDDESINELVIGEDGRLWSALDRYVEEKNPDFTRAEKAREVIRLIDVVQQLNIDIDVNELDGGTVLQIEG